MVLEVIGLFAAYQLGKFVARRPAGKPWINFRKFKIDRFDLGLCRSRSNRYLKGGQYIHYRFEWGTGKIKFKVKTSNDVTVWMLTTDQLNDWLGGKTNLLKRKMHTVLAGSSGSFNMNVPEDVCKYVVICNSGKGDAEIDVRF
jgi:hypothetical protein